MANFVQGNSAYGLPVGNMRKIRMIQRTIDAAKTNLATGVHEVLPVPANCLVLTAGVEVLVKTIGSGVVNLGDGADDDRYVSSAAPTSPGQLTRANTGNLVLYGTADTIDIKVATAAINDATLRVWALVADISK